MGLVLAVTVGGQCQPIITALREYRPDFVCFVVSGGERGSRRVVDGRGGPCNGEPSIVEQLGLQAEQHEIVELADHPWFVACQFHPEFKSRPLAPHPLFEGFVRAAMEGR